MSRECPVGPRVEPRCVVRNKFKKNKQTSIDRVFLLTVRLKMLFIDATNKEAVITMRIFVYAIDQRNGRKERI
uniref:Uncharacterized protein n=1 Tax=Steinernema glaseri TaxID=37863 RepID=A0A1I8A3J8_9BILA